MIGLVLIPPGLEILVSRHHHRPVIKASTTPACETYHHHASYKYSVRMLS